MTGTAAVLVRRVPDPSRLNVDRKTGRLVLEGTPFILNPVDLQALELALRTRERYGHRVVVVSVDHTGAQTELHEALAMGADEAVLVSDPQFEDTDPTTQAHLFRAALERFVHPEIVFAASRSIDHTWSTIGPQLAYLLGWPLVIEAEELDLEDDGVKALAHTGDHRARVQAKLPCVVSVARGVITPRHATSWGIADAFDPHRLTVKTFADLGLGAEAAERLHAATSVRRVALAPTERDRRVIDGDADEVARVLARRLIDKGWGGRRP